MKISSAQIVCVGTELLLGDIVNTNEAYIAARLRELGVPLSDLPDNVQEDVRAGMGFDDEVTLEKWLESVQS